MNEQQISDIWSLFKAYTDKKQIEAVAEKFVDLLADYGVDDLQFRGALGTDAALDEAISYYLELDEEDEED